MADPVVERPPSSGAQRIAAERARQVDVEGWSKAHDVTEHQDGGLLLAAACYIEQAGGWDFTGGVSWPFDGYLKFADPIRMLEKAGALIAAEIDRRLIEQILDGAYGNDGDG